MSSWNIDVQCEQRTYGLPCFAITRFSTYFIFQRWRKLCFFIFFLTATEICQTRINCPVFCGQCEDKTLAYYFFFFPACNIDRLYNILHVSRLLNARVSFLQFLVVCGCVQSCAAAHFRFISWKMCSAHLIPVRVITLHHFAELVVWHVSTTATKLVRWAPNQTSSCPNLSCSFLARAFGVSITRRACTFNRVLIALIVACTIFVSPFGAVFL